MDNLLKLYKQYRIILFCCLFILGWFLILFLTSLTKGYLYSKDRERKKAELLASYSNNKNLWPHQQYNITRKVLARSPSKKQNKNFFPSIKKESIVDLIVKYFQQINNTNILDFDQKQLLTVFRDMPITLQPTQKSILIQLPYFTNQPDE